MTGVRQSILVGKETSFGSGQKKDKWISLPPNFFVQATASVSTTELYSEGSKFFDTVDYGQFSGSWEMSFAMDYDHLALFEMVFDTVSSDTDTTAPVGTTRYKHRFSLKNNATVPSYVIKGVILNKITSGGGKNERYTLKGCVAKNIRFSRSSGAARTTVTISGFYADEEVELTDDNTSYFDEYDGSLVEFSCLFKGEVSEADYMSNVESITVGLDIGINPVYATCRGTAVGYNFGKADIQLGMTAYANDFERYRINVMGGGKETTRIENGSYKFMCKQKRPMPKMTIASFTECYDSKTSFNGVMNKSDRSVAFILEDVVMNSFTRQKGDGSRLIDQMSSSKCRKFTLEVINEHADLGYRTDSPVA